MFSDNLFDIFYLISLLQWCVSIIIMYLLNCMYLHIYRLSQKTTYYLIEDV
jgi:hypothetical protein